MSYPRVIFNVLRGLALLFAGSLCVHLPADIQGRDKGRGGRGRTGRTNGLHWSAGRSALFHEEKKQSAAAAGPSNMEVDQKGSPCIFHAEREDVSKSLLGVHTESEDICDREAKRGAFDPEERRRKSA